MTVPKSGAEDLIAGGVVAAYRTIAPAWRGAWASLGLCGLATGLWWATALQRPHAASALAWPVMAAITGLMAKGAVFRLALARGRPGPAGLQLGRVEGLLILVGLLSFAFLLVLGLLYFVVLLCTAYAVASAGPGFIASQVATWSSAIVGRGRGVFGAVALLGLTGMVWAGARISLAAAVTVSTDKLEVLSTWPMTRDRVAQIVLAMVLTGLLPFMLAALISRAADALVADAQLVFAARVASGLILTGLWVPMSIGLLVHFQRRLG